MAPPPCIDVAHDNQFDAWAPALTVTRGDSDERVGGESVERLALPVPRRCVPTKTLGGELDPAHEGHARRRR